MQQHGWTLLFHDNLIEQMMTLRTAVLRAQKDDPQGFGSKLNVKFFRALVQVMQDVVPSNPARDEYRQGNTMGPAYRHWRRAKLGRRYRLCFRYDSKTKVFVYAWVNPSRPLAGCQWSSPEAYNSSLENTFMLLRIRREL